MKLIKKGNKGERVKMDTEIEQVRAFLSSATAEDIVESLTVGHWVRRIEMLPECQWPEAIEKVPLEPAWPHRSDMTLRAKVRQMMDLEKSKRRVHFYFNEYVYNHETGELQCKNGN